MTTLRNRRAFTLLELVAVLAAIIILGAILVPTLTGARGDTQTKAGADIMQSYMARARTKAIEDGVAYRLAISADGKRVRISPDTFEALGEMPNVDDDDGSNAAEIREDDLPLGVTAAIVTTDDDFISQDQSGWKRVATFLPDGTCREDAVELRVEEKGVTPIVIHLRGVTGACSTSRGGSSP